MFNKPVEQKRKRKISWWIGLTILKYMLSLAIILLLFGAIVFFFMLRYSISMLNSKIIVGPEMLILDGAEEITPKRKLWHALMGGLYITDLIVEIPWEDVARLSSDEAELTVDTKSGRRFIMNLGYFDIRVRIEISKYHKIEDIED